MANNRKNTQRAGDGSDTLESLCREVGLVAHADQGERTEFVRIPGLDSVGSSEAQGSPRSRRESGVQPPALPPAQVQRRLRHGGQETAAAAGPSRGAGGGLPRGEKCQQSRYGDGLSSGSDDGRNQGESSAEVITLDDSDVETDILAGYGLVAVPASASNFPPSPYPDLGEPLDLGSPIPVDKGDDEGGLGQLPEANSGREEPGGRGLQILFKEFVGAYSAQFPRLGLDEIYHLAGRHLARLGFKLPEFLNVATDHELGD